MDDCVKQDLISLPASTICKKTNAQQVILNVDGIVLARTKVLKKLIRRNFSLIHR